VWLSASQREEALLRLPDSDKFKQKEKIPRKKNGTGSKQTVYFHNLIISDDCLSVFSPKVDILEAAKDQYCRDLFGDILDRENQ
jgi:hypothetical protein